MSGWSLLDRYDTHLHSGEIRISNLHKHSKAEGTLLFSAHQCENIAALSVITGLKYKKYIHIYHGIYECTFII